MLYNNLSSYLKNKYGCSVGKICIDGGFSCPNRDGTVGCGGCIFCGERGAGEHIDPTLSIGEQVRAVLASPGRKYGKYIAYFQNFTNTYAPVEVLKRRYDAALIDPRIAVLAIGTRPDCINDEVARLLASYKDRLDVWVELGLQSASDQTARLINRGYPTEVYRRAVNLLDSYGISVVTHMIIGLPKEGEKEILETVELINSSKSFGVKIHSLYVSEGTALAELYRQGSYTPPTMEEYVRLAALAVRRLRPDLIIHRLTGDCPTGLLVAPMWNSEKNLVLDSIRKTLEEEGCQGSLYKKNV